MMNDKQKPVKTRYIIREVPADQCELSYYFDDDGLTEKGGDWNYNLFIVYRDRWGRIEGFNTDTYTDIVKQADNIVYEFANIGGWNNYASYKEVMRDFCVDYNPHKCHRLKEWAKDAGTHTYLNTEDIAKFLTITTGEEWAVTSARGYSQGDYVEIVYCKKHYRQPEAYGEVWLGAAREFCVITLNDNSEEEDAVYGYIVADCQAWRDEDYKKLVCEWYGCDEEEATLEMIDGYSTYTVASYRTA